MLTEELEAISAIVDRMDLTMAAIEEEVAANQPSAKGMFIDRANEMKRICDELIAAAEAT